MNAFDHSATSFIDPNEWTSACPALYLSFPLVFKLTPIHRVWPAPKHAMCVDTIDKNCNVAVDNQKY